MTVQIRDSDGTVRLSGDLLATGGATGDVLTQQTDGTYTPAAGGSPPVTARELLSGNNVAVGAGSTELLTWSKDSGDTLLDVSDSNQPTIITGGVYAVTVSVITTGLASGRPFGVRMDLDALGSTATAAGNATATAFLSAVDVSLCIVSFLPAAAEVNVSVTNGDADFVAYRIQYAIVQQIS